ncbi:MAG: hypothetical protein ACLFNT_09550 [Spirochaetales bacterium]
MKAIFCLLLSAAWLLLPFQVQALAAANPDYDYSVDLPVGWSGAGAESTDHIAFVNPSGEAMLQIIALDPMTARDASAIAEEMYTSLEATAEPEAYTYQGHDSTLSDISFEMNGKPVRGYMITINAPQADFVLLSFAFEEAYDVAHDHMLSAVDSFALGEEGRLYPGPVSQFFYPFPGANMQTQTLRFDGSRLPFAYDSGEIEASSVLVEREARVLAPYGALDEETAYDAWRRYFRQIYRDNFMRLESVAVEIKGILEERGISRDEYPEQILDWLQGFQFSRAGGVSDFMPPILCLSTSAGDCDSLAMTYVIILHHLGFDAIMMASSRYDHALAAVDVAGDGARYNYEGRDWLIAELTADVDLGQIRADIADPAGWIGVRMRMRALE